MHIKFLSVHLYNFLSFSDATINLDTNGYVLVSGKNENHDDSAKSNGSGKTAIFEAIAWAITGQTMRGSKDVSNMYGNDGALVELDFEIDGTKYKIIRTKDHSKYKTNLKLFIDDKDVSGKGIRDTTKLLEEYLPDLTTQLICSVIILGQGLPYRFSNNTPSGRKEVLEQLSKSDFMIDDLKNRVNERKSDLASQIRKIEDKSLELNTTEKIIDKSISDLTNELNQIKSVNVDELNEKISLIKEAIINCNNLIDSYNEKYKDIESMKDDQLSLQDTIKNKLSQEIIDSNNKFNNDTVTQSNKITENRVKLQSLNSQLRSFESIVDVCPTCHQKLQGVEKPDTTELKKQISDLTEETNLLMSELDSLKQKHQLETVQIQTTYNQKLVPIQNKIQELQQEKNKIFNDKQMVESRLSIRQNELNQLMYQQQNYNQKLQETENRLEEANKSKQDLQNKILYYNNEHNDLLKHSELINKIITLINRDFRGHLLMNVIDFINRKSKEYALDVFDNDKIDFQLDGNNISISYDGKEYESLSGGEKQKLDLIIQFSIRDMLCKFLNFSSNILIVDELFDNLDSIGCQKVLNLISKRLNDVNTIYIVTHHAEIEIPTDHELVVIKGADKISRLK